MKSCIKVWLRALSQRWPRWKVSLGKEVPSCFQRAVCGDRRRWGGVGGSWGALVLGVRHQLPITVQRKLSGVASLNLFLSP